MTAWSDALETCAREAALDQRARLLEAVWSRDELRSLLPGLLLPPAPACTVPLEDYAVDLALAPDGRWRVLRDHVGAHPGASLLQAPLLAVFLPALCRSLLQQSLALQSWPVWWWHEPATRSRVAAQPARFCVRDGLDPEAEEVELGALSSPAARRSVQRAVDARPERMVVSLRRDTRDSVRVAWPRVSVA